MQSACAVLYCHLWPVWLYHSFPDYLTNGTIFGKVVIGYKMCVFWFSLQILPETFLSLRIIRQDIIIYVRRSSCKVPVYSCQILMKLEFPRQIFEKYPSIKFHEILCSESPVVPYGPTDGHFANAPKNCTSYTDAVRTWDIIQYLVYFGVGLSDRGFSLNSTY
jgi:hypothetical protein